jgi:hypothetical protein
MLASTGRSIAQESDGPIEVPTHLLVSADDYTYADGMDYAEDIGNSYDPWHRAMCGGMLCWINDWHGNFDLGLNGTSGNTQNLNLATVLAAERLAGSTYQSLDFNYFYANAFSQTSQNQLYTKFRNEMALADSAFNWFFDVWYLYNQFNDSFLGFNTGISITAIDDGVTRLAPRIGIGAPDLYFGLDFERKIHSCQRIFATVDYYPDFDFEEFRLITHAGWELMVDQDRGIHIQLVVWDWYNGTRRSGVDANDVAYLAMIGRTF